MSWYGGWRPYVPVARRRANAAKHASNLAKREGRKLAPVAIEGRQIAASFWGKAWCENLERYSDFANRLPRGRTYLRNGSVIDLQIKRGVVKAIVSGSEIYEVKIQIQTLPAATWKKIKQDCSQSVASLMDLLQGRFDQGIMQRLTQREGGLFPQPKEIEMDCSCPDWAGMCKHVAATLYGVGSRLDCEPEMLFTLRDVDHLELVSQAVSADNLDRALNAGQDDALSGSDLGELFGIDIASGDQSATEPTAKAGAASVVVVAKSARDPAVKSRRASQKRPGKKTSLRKTVAPATSKSVGIATPRRRRAATATRE